MAISFVELAGSPTISVEGERLTARRIFRINWDDWYDFAKELLGSWTVVGGQHFFREPKKFPGLTNVYVKGLTIEPYQPDAPDGTTSLVTVESATNHYTHAKISVTYGVPESRDSSPLMPDNPDGTFLEYSTDIGGQYMTTGNKWQWHGDSKAVDSTTSPGIFVPTIEHDLTWYQVPIPPWAAIRSAMGKVNSGSYIGASAGTLLFTGASASRVFNFTRADIGNYWTLHYHFSERNLYDSSGGPYGWNYFYRGDAASGSHWQLLEDQGTGNYAFATSSFSGLFSF